MKSPVVVGAKAPTPPTVCNHQHFLYDDSKFTIEMVEWYYKTPSTESIHMTDIDDRTSVVEITELHDQKIIRRSFTIGKKIKSMIYEMYMFYHPVENG